MNSRTADYQMPDHLYVAWDRLSALALNAALWASILWLAGRLVMRGLA